MDLAQVVTELEWVHPDLPGTAVGLGPPAPDGVSTARDAVVALVAAARETAARLVVQDGDVMAVTDLMALARAAHLLAVAPGG